MTKKTDFLTRLNEFSSENIAEKIGITRTSALRWKKGKVIHYRYFEKLDELLKLDEGTTENYTKDLLTKRGKD